MSTFGIIWATSRPLVGLNKDNPPPVVPLPTLNDISATTSFNIPLAEGALLVAPTGAMTAKSTYTITPNDGRVAVQGGAYVRGPSDWSTAGVTVFTVLETFTGPTGESVSRTSTLTVTSVAPVVVVPGFATVVDAVGRNTRSGVKIGQLPAGATLSGTNATHFNVDALGQVTVSAAGQTAGLASSYNMTVVGGGSITTMAFNTLANEWTATNAAELMAAATALKTLTNLDRKIVLPTGTVISTAVTLQTFLMDGTIVDANSNLLPQDVDVTGWNTYVGLNGKQAYNPNSTASVSGGSITIYCPTVMGAKIDAQFRCVDVRPILFLNLDFNRMSGVDMYDSKATAPTYITREAVISVTSVNGTGGVLAVNFDDTGAGYPPGYTVHINKASGAGTGFAASAVAKADGTLDASTFLVLAAGSAHTTATKLRAFDIRVWDPRQPAGTDTLNNLFYQCFISSSSIKYDDAVANDYSSVVFRSCRFGISSRSDATVLRYNRTLGLSTHNWLIIEDCLFDGMWIGVGHRNWCRTELRRNAFINYINDIIDTYPTTANNDPTGVRYPQLAAPFRNEAVMIVTGNYIGRPNQSSLLMSNSHSDGHQHSAGGDLIKQNILYACNILNMNCSSTYITTQGYLDNGDGVTAKRVQMKYNFCAASTTNSIMTSYTDTSDPNGSVFQNNFSTRTIYGAGDLGGGVDGIGGGINPIKNVQGTVIRRNTIKEVWDMGPGDGGRIFSNPAGGVMTKFNQPTVPRSNGPIYISDNYFISYLTPNTGAGNSYPEVFKGVNAAGTGGAFIWNPTTGAGGTVAIGFHRWWEIVRDTPATNSWTDTWAAVARGKADIQSIFTPQAGSGADGRHCFPAEAF